MQYNDCPTGLKWLHKECRKGSKSCCNYQRHKVIETSTYAPPKNPLSDAIAKVAMPIFYRSSNQGLLARCKNVSNRMPMSHSIKFCGLFVQKEQFNSLMATSFAGSLAVCFCNSGFEYTITSLLKIAGLEFDICTQKQWCSIDTVRVMKGDYVVSDTWKEKCKLRN